MTYNAFAEVLDTLAVEEGYTVNGEYLNSQTKIGFTHLKCGFSFDMAPNKFKRGRRCPKCSGVERYTTETFAVRIASLTDGEWELTGSYTTTRTVTQFRHRCGTVMSISPNRFQAGIKECEGCGSRVPDLFAKTDRKKKTKEEWQSDIDRVYGPKRYEIIGNYVNSMTPMDVKCMKCDMISSKRLDAMVYHAEGCAECSGLRKKTPDEAVVAIESIDGYTLLNPEEFENTKQVLRLKHEPCGTEYMVRYKDFINKGHRCRNCRVSGPEQELRDLISTLCHDVVFNDRSTIPPYEIDMLIPSLKIGIEYNGSYWHREEKKGREYHAKKQKMAADTGVCLIQIMDSEWIHNREIVEEKVTHLLGGSRKRWEDYEVVGARKCDIGNVDFVEVRSFMTMVHTQGHDPSAAKSVALWYEGVMVACASFSPASRLSGKGASDGEMILTRYATEPGYSVPGGFPKLVKFFLRENPDVVRLVTYADLRWGDGGLYRKCGWIEDGLVDPTYCYVHVPSAKAYHRSSFTKKKIKYKLPRAYDDSLTEKEMMSNTNFFRVWDAGKIRFILER